VRNVETAIGKMPDVIGLTETAVRRILKSIDLRLNPVYQSNPNVVNGDSFKQSPTPGTDIQANQLITVIFSKHEQQ
jgi:beta-lactam-binding protein with PASTA domain